MRKKSRQKRPAAPERREALDCIPLRHPDIREEILENGDILIFYPLRMKAWISKILGKLGKIPPKPPLGKLQLDELGSAVWQQINGRQSVRQIIREFTRQYQLHPKEAEVSVTLFLRSLGKRGLIGMK